MDGWMEKRGGFALVLVLVLVVEYNTSVDWDCME